MSLLCLVWLFHHVSSEMYDQGHHILLLASFLKQPPPLVTLMSLNPKETFPQLSLLEPPYSWQPVSKRVTLAAVELQCPE